MPQLPRDTQIQRLNAAIARWITIYRFEEPFSVSQLWDGGGNAPALISGLQVPDDQAVARCREYAEAGLLEELAGPAFKPTRAFTRERAEAFRQRGASTPAEVFDTSGKEPDQKFEILLSLRQGAREFAKALKECAEQRQPISLVFVDIDHFKGLNDKHTESVIDRTLLPDFMKLLKIHSWARAHPCLQGGDEFLLVMPNSSLEEARLFAERFRQLVEASTFHVGSVSEKITVSAGVASWPDDGSAFQRFLDAASAAKAIAKKTRRNAVSTSRGLVGE